MLESDTGVKTFPLNDQEILCRHIHNIAQDHVRRYREENGRA